MAESVGEKTQGRLPSVFYNLATLTGAALAGISLGLILFLFVLEKSSPTAHPYMGIIAFVILPVFLILGLGLVGMGIWREWRRRTRGVVTVMPRIDLNEPSHRAALLLVGVSAILFVSLTAFGSFQAFEYTESNAFCGTVCHTVMHPEYASYAQSPHARVDCVDCHIGSGAEWFVRSKLSGSYQLYSVLFDKFPRPIETPIESLRPSSDTCEQCHWPAYFYREKLDVRDYYLLDEANTHKSLGILMKIGGGGVRGDGATGIHWHMNIANEVHYVASDDRRLEIPWVRVRSRDGREKVYVDQEADFSEEDLADAEMRTMDCLDCHNRPTHAFRPPHRELNSLLSHGRIDRTLPSIKSVAVDALEQGYETEEAAMAGIEERIRSFYQEHHPDLLATRDADVARAIEEVQGVYRINYFPLMKVSWREFPDHRGHLYAPGCFRCHDGNHVSEDGSVISRDCNVCHTVLSAEVDGQGEPLSLSSKPFRHPVDIDDAWQFMNCSDCHGG